MPTTRPRRRALYGALLPTCALAASCATLPHAPHACGTGLDGSFIQLGAADLSRDEQSWRARLAHLARLGARTVVVQYSGDDRGSYDARTPSLRPVASLLMAAEELGLSVYLGLYNHGQWPHGQRNHRPLPDLAAVRTVGALCRAHEACVGWYVPQEIDEYTWRDDLGVAYLREWLMNTSAALRAELPLPVAIAPYYAETLDASEYAAFWERVLVPGAVDIVMLQDGTGARGTALSRIREALSALRPVLKRKRAALWSVVELFTLTSGPPLNDAEFSATPASFARVRDQLAAERPLVDATIAFTILDYMLPTASQESSDLYTQYARYCQR